MRAGAKAEVSCSLTARGNRDLHRLFRAHARTFMPGYDGICSRRHALDRKAAVFRTHRKEWVLQNADVGLHPRVLVALHRNHGFSRVQFMSERSRAIGLRLVPVRVQLRSEV